MKIKFFIRLVIIYIFVYLILSLPHIFGIGVGYVIDWTAEATVSQKLKGYLIEGLKYGMGLKLIIATVLGVGGCIIWSKKHKKIRF